VLHVRRADRDASGLLFRRLIDLIESHKMHLRVRLRQNLRYRRRQSRLAVVHVSYRPDVHVRLAPIKFLFAHVAFLYLASSAGNARLYTKLFLEPAMRFEFMTSSL